LGIKVILTLIMHKVFGVGIIGVSIMVILETVVKDLKQRIMKKLQYNFKNILSGVLPGS